MKWLSKALAALPSWDVVAVEEMAGPGVPARRHTYRAVLSAAVALAEELVPGPPLEPGSLTVGILTGNAVEGVVADAACLLAGRGGRRRRGVPARRGPVGADPARLRPRPGPPPPLDRGGVRRRRAGP
ncbi:MAG: hypothetical protein NTW05_00825 [Pseudonocardiales bacterium]|nr:hypothetical protein [Pseudonocardiales bacterium]